MINEAEKRGQIIRHLEEALALADEIEDGNTGFLIELALDEARSQQFRPAHHRCHLRATANAIFERTASRLL
jgi:hypothetical protein